jgi:hypothetical protein
MSDAKVINVLSHLFSSLIASAVMIVLVFYGFGLFLGGLAPTRDFSPMSLILSNPIASMIIWIVLAAFFYLLGRGLGANVGKYAHLIPFINAICFIANFLVAFICWQQIIGLIDAATAGRGPSAGYAALCIYTPLSIGIVAIVFLGLVFFQLRFIRKTLNVPQLKQGKTKPKNDW